MNETGLSKRQKGPPAAPTAQEVTVKVRIALATLAGVATLATVGVTTAATAASASTATPATTAASARTVSHVMPKPPPACTVGQLSAKFVQSVKGHLHTYTLTLTNKSPKACTVSGPLSVTLYGKYGPLNTTVIQVPVKPAPPKGLPGPIVLQSGQSATATISFAVMGPWSPSYYMRPPFYGGTATKMFVTLPQFHRQGYFLKFPTPVKVFKNTVSVTALIGPSFPIHH
jgi:hypothetical protein